jgi:hypothetical protein
VQNEAFSDKDWPCSRTMRMRDSMASLYSSTPARSALSTRALRPTDMLSSTRRSTMNMVNSKGAAAVTNKAKMIFHSNLPMRHMTSPRYRAGSLISRER